MKAVGRGLGWGMGWALGAAVAGMLAATAPGQAAMPARDPDWPCQAIKVGDLSLGALWTGPDIGKATAEWTGDPAVKALVERLVQRRLPLEDARRAIADFAAPPDPGRAERLLRLFAGLFQTLGEERSAVLAGLDRYGHRQKQLADQVRAEADDLRAAQGDAAADPARAQALVQRLTWDTRVFEDRRQMLSAACDVPNVIEQRLYALAQAVQAALPP